VSFVVSERGHGNIFSHLPTLLNSYTQVINGRQKLKNIQLP
jgi:hypothetical protein